MGLDLSGGLDPSLDFPILEPPGVPGFGENHAFWIFDRAGRFFVNFHLENVAGLWKVRREWGYVVLPNSRALVVQREGSVATARCAGAATAWFCCEEPFRRWSGRFRGTARDTSLADVVTGPVVDGPRSLVELEFEATMALPPWVQGSVSASAGKEMSKDAGRHIGGFRYEQLFRATVVADVGGEPHRFSATGLRTHRAGPRQIGTMLGHSWATAVLPSERAFGLMRFPKPDGSVGFSEGWLMEDGKRLEARVVESPWLEELRPTGERFRVKLESPAGTAEIDGETVATVFLTVCGESDLGYVRAGLHRAPGLVLAQSMARYTWNGEETYGLLERSAPRSRFGGAA
ncbi:MAG: DUF7064 domain-containing protein [Candidatus Binatia bacterium]